MADTHVQQSPRGCVTSRAEVKAELPSSDACFHLAYLHCSYTTRYNTSQGKFAVG